MGLSIVLLLLTLTSSFAHRNLRRCDRPCEDELRDISVFPDSLWWLGSYSVSNAQYNLVPPRFVAQPKSTGDVQRVLQCATRNKINVSVKAGGHNYAGFSAASGGIQLDLRSNMCREIVDVSNEFGEPAIRVGAGCLFSQVYEWLYDNKREYVLAGGVCPSVGVSGFHLAGGVGPLSRAFGMGAENVLQAEVVTPNGTVVVVANKDQHSDLLFALRGGGGGSFGVVTEWVFRVHSTVEANFSVFSYGEFCPEDKKEVFQRTLYNLVDALPTMPQWLSVSWRFTRNSKIPQGGLCILYYSFRGAREGYSWLQERGIIDTKSVPLERFPHVGDNDGDGTSTDHNGNFYAEYESYFALALERARFTGERQFNPTPYKTANCIIPQFSRDAAEVLLDQYDALAASNNALCYVVGFSLPGRAASRDIAFPYSSARYVAEMDCTLRSTETYDGATKALRNWRDGFAGKNLCAGAFLNFPFRNLTDFPTQYWSSNAQRLSQVRRAYNPDPENVLKFEQQVPL